ncbi:MAG TPA: PAS domain-containing protein [Rhizomicrobium sp.]
MVERTQTISDAFNAIAIREDWGSRCDPQLEFRCPALSALLALWRQKAAAGPLPARKDFSLRSLKAFLRDIAIYERVFAGEARWRYRVRLMGTSFAETMGDLTGKFLDEAIPKAFLPHWCAALDAAFEAGAPLRFVARSDTVNKHFLLAEYFQAPLLDDDGNANLILASSHFSSSEKRSRMLAAELARCPAADTASPA